MLDGWSQELTIGIKLLQVQNAIITTLDQGLSLAVEFEGHGFEKIASWITPSWDDINTRNNKQILFKNIKRTLMQFLIS